MKHTGGVIGLVLAAVFSSACANGDDVISRDAVFKEPLKFKLDMSFINNMDALAADLKAYEATHKEFKFNPEQPEVWSATLAHDPDLSPFLEKNHLTAHQALVGMMAITYSGGNASAVKGSPHAEDYLTDLQKHQGQIAADNVRFYVVHEAEILKFGQDWISLR